MPELRHLERIALCCLKPPESGTAATGNCPTGAQRAQGTEWGAWPLWASVATDRDPGALGPQRLDRPPSLPLGPSSQWRFPIS